MPLDVCFLVVPSWTLLADAGGRVAAGGVGALLEVEAPAAAPDADRVRLVPALAEAARTLLPCKITGTATRSSMLAIEGSSLSWAQAVAGARGTAARCLTRPRPPRVCQ